MFACFAYANDTHSRVLNYYGVVTPSDGCEYSLIDIERKKKNSRTNLYSFSVA